MDIKIPKTRFAPSPTGTLHVGNVRTALFNYLSALHQQGIFLLRIEDTDLERSQSQSLMAIRDDLLWMGLQWQEGPYIDIADSDQADMPEKVRYFQSQRGQIYQDILDKLVENGVVYPCYCTEERLSNLRQLQLKLKRAPRYDGHCRELTPSKQQAAMEQGHVPVMRFCMPNTGTITFEDLVRGPQRFECQYIGDFVIQRANGHFTFLYCNAIDDALMQVTQVIRGEDHLSNTPRQIALLDRLGFPEPQYGHLPLVMDSDNQPLSKRQGGYTVQGLREKGYLPMAICNYLARLGHTYSSNEFYENLDALAQDFSLKRVSRSSAFFDPKQLDYWQKQAILQLTDHAYWQWIEPWVGEKVLPENRAAFIPLAMKNTLFPRQAGAWADELYALELDYAPDQKRVIKEAGMSFFEQALACVDILYAGEFEDGLASMRGKTGLRGKAFFEPLRVALTGQFYGVPFVDIVHLMPQDIFIRRLRQAKLIAQDDGRVL